MNEAVWMGDKEEKTLYANPKFCDLTEYNLEEIIGKESYIFWDEVSKKRVRAENTEKRKKGVTSSYEWTLLTKSGKKIPVLLNGTPTDEWGTIGIMTDLRQLKEKEKNETILWNAIKFSSSALIIVHRNGEILLWNNGSQMVFWYKSEEIIGKNIVGTIFTQEGFESCFEDSTKYTYRYEIQALHKDTTPLNISITLTPTEPNNLEENDSFLIVCHDISYHRRLEEELQLKHRKIREIYEEYGVLKRQDDYIFELLDLARRYEYDKKSVGDFIVTSVIMLTQASASILRLYDEKKWVLKSISRFWLSEGWEGKKVINYKGSLLEKAIKHWGPLKIIDIHSEPLYQSTGLARKNNLSSLFLIPLKRRDSVIGSLSLYTRSDKKWEILENDFIEKYSRIIEIVLWNMK